MSALCFVECTRCDGSGEITDPDHPDHWSKTGDGEGETWCLDCGGDGGWDYDEDEQRWVCPKGRPPEPPKLLGGVQ